MAGGKPNSALPKWHRDLIVTGKGEPKALLANAMTVLRADDNFRGSIAFDALRDEAMVIGELPWNGSFRIARPWKDNDDRWLAEWLQNNDIHIGINIAAEAVQAVAAENSFHPVLDYFKRIKWDGISRLDNWATDYLGCADTPYNRVVAAKWLISAVARVFQPGCKADCVLVLEGKQGTFKSTALRTIGAPWFTDEIAALGSKDAAEQTIGVWIVELAELDAVTRAADVAHVKSFVSRQTDRFRMSYGRRVGEHPRQCVFAATSNASQWNRDDTGGRRWWPLSTGFIDIDGLNERRDQLWAEARDRYETGETWWLEDTQIIEAAMIEQSSRMVEDPISESVMGEANSFSAVSTSQIMTALGYPKERQTKGEAMRIGSILRQEGWSRRRVREGSDLAWKYFRPE